MNKLIYDPLILSSMAIYSVFSVAAENNVDTFKETAQLTVYPSQLSPEEKAEGRLPSGYDIVVFLQYPGNWMEDIRLPLMHNINNDAVASITQLGSNSSQLHLENTLYTCAEPLKIESSELKRMYVFDPDKAHWYSAAGKSVGTKREHIMKKAAEDFHRIISLPQDITHVTIQHQENISKIQLPEKADDRNILLLETRDTKPTLVIGDNLLGRDVKVNRHFSELFQYDKSKNKWVNVSLRCRVKALLEMKRPKLGKIDPRKIDSNVKKMLPSKNGNVLEKISDFPGKNVQFDMWNGMWVKEIRLPEKAEDKSIFSVSSKATYSSRISGDNLESGTIDIFKDSVLQFCFNATQGKWKICDSNP